jgi:hypothetical protein
LDITETITATSDIERNEKIESHSGDPSNAWTLRSFDCHSEDGASDGSVSTHYYRKGGEISNCEFEGTTLVYLWRAVKGKRVYKSTQRDRTFVNGIMDNHVFISATLFTHISLRLGKGLCKSNGNRRIALWCPPGEYRQHNKSGGNCTWVYEYECARAFLPYQGFSYYLVDEVTASGKPVQPTGADDRSDSP